MAPEQERAEVVGPAADVFSLGATLAEILVGKTRVRADDTRLPSDLLELCRRSLDPDPDGRPRNAGVFSAELLAWLEGAKDQEKAQRLLEQAEAMRPRIARLRAQAVVKGSAASALAAVTPSWAGVAEKAAQWALEDESRELDAEAESQFLQAVHLLCGALSHAPRLSAAHRALAEHFRWRHEKAETDGDIPGALRAAVLLRDHDDGRYTDWLAGDGRLTLVTDPPGASVTLHRFVERERRLVPDPVGALGVTPLRSVSLPMGSYLLEIRAPGRTDVRYPVRVGRQEHWDGVAPGATEPVAVVLPLERAIGPDEVYVPPGWFVAGGEPNGFGALSRRRVWVDGFCMARFPVTLGDFVAYLNTLPSAEALRLVPRMRSAQPEVIGGLALSKRDGKFVVGSVDPEDDADQPVSRVTWFAAQAYSRYHALRTGLPWRLPSELEWEKAARGTDGRDFPWGNYLDHTWANVDGSREGRGRLAPVDSCPIDVSVYGVRGLGGNVQDWCLEVWRPEGPAVDLGRSVRPTGDTTEGDLRVNKGGFWNGTAHFARSSMRSWNAPANRHASLGFRLARSLSSGS